MKTPWPRSFYAAAIMVGGCGFPPPILIGPEEGPLGVRST